MPREGYDFVERSIEGNTPLVLRPCITVAKDKYSAGETKFTTRKTKAV